MNNLIHLQRFLHARDNLRRLRESLAPGINFFSICSGIEAASVAWNPLGWRCVGVSEIEKFPSAVLGHHYPHVRNHGDFTKIDASRLPRVDILCGGTPCQAFSVAGSRRSLDDARGNLTLAFVKLAHEINPRNVVWENVPGVLSTKDNAFGCFLAGLVGATDAIVTPDGKRWPNAGMVAGPKGRAAWRVLDAQYFGLAQRRKRVILVADFGNGADPAAVLFEPESVRRDSPPSRETGQTTTSPIAPSLTASGRGVERTGDTRGQDPVVAVMAYGGNRTSGPLDVATAVNAHGGPCGRLDFESETFVVAGSVHAIQAGALRTNPNSGPDGVGVQADIAYTLEARAEVQAVSVTGSISHALKAEGADASEDGTGRGTPIIAFSAKDYGADASIDLAPTLRAGGHTMSHANAGVMPAIAYGFQPRIARNGRGDMGDVVSALNAQSGETGKGDAAPCVALTSAVRRLTPKECERLQGFPDDYTRIPWRNRPASDCPDGPRYKALGNSWAVPLFNWLGKRIAARL